MTRPRPALPDRLARRPFDDRRGVPVPFMNVRTEGDGEEVWDYTTIFWPQVERCAVERLCGLCGEPLAYWIAFLGGPISAANRAYLDPPGHEECLEAALQLCPHIAIPHAKRASDKRVTPGAHTPSDMTLEKVPEWIMVITRDFRVEVRREGPYFKAGTVKRQRRFVYDEAGGLVEQSGR